MSPAGTEAQYNKAVAVIRAAGSVSIPLLKRELNINWQDAAKLVELMEYRGIIGPFDGMKPREIRAVDYDAENKRMADEHAERNAWARGRITEKKMQIALSGLLTAMGKSPEQIQKMIAEVDTSPETK